MKGMVGYWGRGGGYVLFGVEERSRHVAQLLDGRLVQLLELFQTLNPRVNIIRRHDRRTARRRVHGETLMENDHRWHADVSRGFNRGQ